MFSKYFWRLGESKRLLVWLNQLKIAIIEKNIEQLEVLMQDIPQLSKAEDIDSAICLINEAKNLVVELRDDTQASMIQMKKNIDFLKVTQVNNISSLDVTL